MGGIETYLHQTKALLETQGHHVVLYGGQLPRGKLGELRIYLGLFFSLLNVWDKRKLQALIQQEQPDLIWYHSLLRNLGAGVVAV